MKVTRLHHAHKDTGETTEWVCAIGPVTVVVSRWKGVYGQRNTVSYGIRGWVA